MKLHIFRGYEGREAGELRFLTLCGRRVRKDQLCGGPAGRRVTCSMCREIEDMKWGFDEPKRLGKAMQARGVRGE